MRKTPFIAALCALALLVSAPAARAEDDAVYPKLIAEKGPSVVAVKIVLAIKFSGMGQSGEREAKTSATGVVVDSSGLIMLPGAVLDAGMGIPRRMRHQFTVKSSPTSIRVVFPGDTKEYEAVLGAKDSKLGLAFILIRDLGGKKLTPISMDAVATPKVGQTLYAVDRLDQGFDYAPMVTPAKVAGHVTKPRDMWIVHGGGGALGMPLFDAAGSVAGIMVNQEGVGEEADSRPFLLPIDKAQATIKSSLSKSKDELDRILEEEEEAAAEAAAAKKDEAKKDEGKKDEGEKKDAPEDDGDK